MNRSMQGLAALALVILTLGLTSCTAEASPEPMSSNNGCR